MRTEEFRHRTVWFEDAFPWLRLGVWRLLAFSMAVLLALAGCMGKKENVADGYHRVGLFDRNNNVTNYTFDDREKAAKLRDKLRKRGYEAEVRRTGSDAGVYEVYVRERVPSAEELRWPPPPSEARIIYIGDLRSRKDLEKFGVNRGGSEGGDKVSFDDVAYGKDYSKVDVLVRPYGVAVDGSGTIYVSDLNGILAFNVDKGSVERFMLTAFDSKQVGGNYAYTPFFSLGTPVLRPMGLAFGSESAMFVADKGFGKVLAFKNKDVMFEIGAEKGVSAPYGVAVDEKMGRLYVTEPSQNALRAYDLTGQFLFSIPAGDAGDEGHEMGAPLGVAVNSRGEIHVIDQGSARVIVYSPEGKFERTIGSYGNYPGQFARPKGIAIDSDDNVYVTDVAFNNVQIFSAQGDLLLVFGEGGNEAGRFFLPINVFVDDRDRVYVSDLGNNRVEVFQYVGERYLTRVETAVESGEQRGEPR